MREGGMGNQNKSSGPFRSIFMHSDGIDKLLMGLGFIGSVGDGLSMPIMLLFTSKIMNNIGGASTNNKYFDHDINKNAKFLCFVALVQGISCFLEGYCWTRTAERQASRMRSGYLKAVLRQDVGYFDLYVTSTSEVITSVSSDSLVIQEVISEKVPVFLMNLFTFIGAYIVAFSVLWRLALVAFPFVIFLVIPGLMYGRALMGIARKMMVEYDKAGIVVEQALSSIRTVYAFVGESKTMANYSTALQGTVNLGLKQGLAKGLAIGSNGIVFAIWSFMAYYGTRLIMYHNASGGNVFAAGASIAIGGLSLGSALSNLKYFSEASAAGEKILKIIKRVPKIDSDNMDGQMLESILGEVEFKNVKFAYPSRPDTPIFQNLNLKIPSGLTVALVGGSGSGKSTVIALLQRFYDPMGGEICLDGVAIDKLQLKWLRSQMGLVSQEPALFATSIKENILFGKEDGDMEEIIAAAKASNAHNFISQLPQGYDTQVMETGSHNELIYDENGLYASLVRMQQRDNKREEIPSNGASTSSNNPKMDSNNNSSRRLSIVSRSTSANSPTSLSQRLDNSSTVRADQDFPVPSFRRLLAMNLPEWRQAMMGCIGAVLFGAIQPLYAFAMGSVISVYFLHDHNEIKYKIRIYSLCFVGLAISSLLINVIQHYNFACMGEHLTKRIRERMLSKILTFEVGWFDQDENSSGAICSRLAKDANVPSENAQCDLRRLRGLPYCKLWLRLIVVPCCGSFATACIFSHVDPH
ncbi:hypothetical protein RHMOL_Rhmol08G0073000 [Rhododendron molle]|uniref:Uncharacterized protein n=1 Tax=Rhododendron molle TaxID=49168 RepID=A0ACC0MKT5_RHOML|nr:hypothetical protein RHMOL_Rhmol08G0073000 [Rhododendron molle]